MYGNCYFYGMINVIRPCPIIIIIAIMNNEQLHMYSCVRSRLILLIICDFFENCFVNVTCSTISRNKICRLSTYLTLYHKITWNTHQSKNIVKLSTPSYLLTSCNKIWKNNKQLDEKRRQRAYGNFLLILLL